MKGYMREKSWKDIKPHLREEDKFWENIKDYILKKFVIVPKDDSEKIVTLLRQRLESFKFTDNHYWIAQNFCENCGILANVPNKTDPNKYSSKRNKICSCY